MKPHFLLLTLLVTSLTCRADTTIPSDASRCYTKFQHDYMQHEQIIKSELYRTHREILNFIVTDYRPIVSNILAGQGDHLNALIAYLETQDPDNLIEYSRCILQENLTIPDFARALIRHKFMSHGDK